MRQRSDRTIFYNAEHAATSIVWKPDQGIDGTNNLGQREVYKPLVITHHGYYLEIWADRATTMRNLERVDRSYVRVVVTLDSGILAENGFNIERVREIAASADQYIGTYFIYETHEIWEAPNTDLALAFQDWIIDMIEFWHNQSEA